MTAIKQNQNDVLQRLGDDPKRMQTIITASYITSKDRIGEHFDILNRYKISARFVEKAPHADFVSFNIKDKSFDLDKNTDNGLLAWGLYVTVDKLINQMKNDKFSYLELEKDNSHVVGNFEFKL